LSADAVLQLTSTLPANQNYKISDNFFTSAVLMERLLERGIHYTGTVRSGQLPNLKLQDDKQLAKQGRKSFDVVVSEKPLISAVKWFDNRSVTLASTFVGAYRVQMVHRWDKAKKCYIKIDRPHIVHQYNQSMGGVDLLDAFVARNRFHLRSKRWYLFLFWHSVSVALVNAWLLYQKDFILMGRCRKDILRWRKF
jgi:hypothetical protein